MPYFGVEFHYWGSEGVFAWYSDVDHVCAALVRGPRWAFEGAFEMCEVVAAADGVSENVGGGVGVDVGHFFGDSTGSVSRHVGDGLIRWIRGSVMR